MIIKKRNVLLFFIIAISVTVLLVACQSQQAQILYNQKISANNTERTYDLYVPSTYKSTKMVPLLILLHGGGQDSNDIMSISHMNEMAEAEGFIVAYPNGIQNSWNDGRESTNAALQHIDDVSFLKVLATTLQQSYNINQDKVFIAGVSNGGIMSYRIACQASSTFNGAIGIVASMAQNLVLNCNPEKPIPILSIQGSNDEFISLNGGEVYHKRFPKLGDGGFIISSEDNQEFWKIANHCESIPMITVLPQKINDGTSTKKISYVECSNNTEVTFYIVEGMGHTWPPYTPEHEDILGKTSQNIDASKEISDFMKRN